MKTLCPPSLFCGLCGVLSAQDTFSIVAVDVATGQVGSAGATCLDDTEIEPVVRSSSAMSSLTVGAIHTQSYWVPANQNAAHDQVVVQGTLSRGTDGLARSQRRPGQPCGAPVRHGRPPVGPGPCGRFHRRQLHGLEGPHRRASTTPSRATSSSVRRSSTANGGGLPPNRGQPWPRSSWRPCRAPMWPVPTPAALEEGVSSRSAFSPGRLSQATAPDDLTLDLLVSSDALWRGAHRRPAGGVQRVERHQPIDRNPGTRLLCSSPGKSDGQVLLKWDGTHPLPI